MPETFIQLLTWLESTALGVWVRESLWGFPLSLSLHALGMGLLVGIHYALALRALGLARQLPWPALLAWQPLLWASALLALVSGLLLLCAYPAKALTNPVFFLKLLLVALGLGLFHLLRAQLRRQPDAALPRWLAPALLLCWTAAIAAGRLLAYTYTVLTASQLVAA